MASMRNGLKPPFGFDIRILIARIHKKFTKLPTDDRWTRYRRTMEGVLKRIAEMG